MALKVTPGPSSGTRAPSTSLHTAELKKHGSIERMWGREEIRPSPKIIFVVVTTPVYCISGCLILRLVTDAV